MEFRVWSLGFGICNLGFGVWNLEFGICGLGFGVRSFRFGIWDPGFGVWDLEPGNAGPVPGPQQWHRVPKATPAGVTLAGGPQGCPRPGCPAPCLVITFGAPPAPLPRPPRAVTCPGAALGRAVPTPALSLSRGAVPGGGGREQLREPGIRARPPRPSGHPPHARPSCHRGRSPAGMSPSRSRAVSLARRGCGRCPPGCPHGCPPGCPLGPPAL